jgi:hypothetical protein
MGSAVGIEDKSGTMAALHGWISAGRVKTLGNVRHNLPRPAGRRPEPRSVPRIPGSASLAWAAAPYPE